MTVSADQFAARATSASPTVAWGVDTAVSGARSVITPGLKRTFTSIGRITGVAMPLAAFDPFLVSNEYRVLLFVLISATWIVAQRAVFRATRPAAGVVLATCFGTGVAAVLVSGLLLWSEALSSREHPLLLEVAATTALVSTAWELFAERYLVSRQKVLILGLDAAASAIAAEALHDPYERFEILGAVDDGASTSPEVPLLGDLAALDDVVEAQRPDLIVLTDTDPGPMVDRLLEANWRAFRVVGVSHFFEDAFGRVPVEHIKPAWFMSVLHMRQSSYTPALKRAFDVVVAFVTLVLLAPALALVSLAVLSSGRSVIYRQRRLGERGKTFEMYKFRTMRPDAEADGRASWAAIGDPRVTWVGRFLRRSRIDELPQLWNVLRGEMSIVGPRPERPEFVALLENSVPYWNRRLLLRPGLTGWAQLHCGYADSCESTASKLSYDLWYMRHRTLLVDVAICLKTLTTVVSGAGAR